MGTYSCASCHVAEAGFHSGRKQGIADGGMGYGEVGESRVPNPTMAIEDIDAQPIRVPTNLNVAYTTNVLWDGQLGATHLNEGTAELWDEDLPSFANHEGFMGPETQALAGQDFHRLVLTDELLNNTDYRALFDIAFHEVQEDERYGAKSVAMAITAYERTMLSNQAPFQRYLRGEENAMTENQMKGATLFFTKAECSTCHNGPSLNGNQFEGIGFNDLGGEGAFNVDPDHTIHLGRGGFTGDPNEMYKFKVPQLYNLRDATFFGHGSSLRSVEEVIRYKNAGIPENPNVPASQISENFRPLYLTEGEILQLVDFIENGLHDPNLTRYKPTSLPSGQCFPNNDALSKIDLGCN